MEQFPIPIRVLDAHLAVLGKTGAGKSYALRGMIECLLDEKRRVCIIDPKGDHWGIKSSYDGKKAGYSVVIFGGDHADVPINPRVGKEIAELVATGNRPCVIDFRGWMPGERTRFWIEFASTLFRSNKEPLWLVMDEVHNFAPQGKVLDPDAGKCLHWTNRIGTEGRGLGIRVLMASQRPQKVHKDLLTCAETLVAMRVIHPLDRNAMKEWIDGCGDAERGRMVLNSLAEMKRGEAFVWSPEIKFFERLTFPKIKTFDSFKAPVGDVKSDAPRGWATVNLDDVRKRLAKTIEEAKANDPELLKARIRELEKGKPRQVDESAISRAMESAKRDAQRESSAMLRSLEATVAKQQAIMKRTAEMLVGLAIEVPKHVPVVTVVKREELRPPIIRSRVFDKVQTSVDVIPLGEKKILNALAQYDDGLTRDELSVITKYRRSSRDAYIARLAGKEFITTGDRICCTEEGRAALGDDFRPLPTGSALIEHWLHSLPIGERAIFQVLVDRYPDSVSRDEISELTPYKRSSRDAYVARLKGRRLLNEAAGGLIASKTLFQ